MDPWVARDSLAMKLYTKISPNTYLKMPFRIRNCSRFAACGDISLARIEALFAGAYRVPFNTDGFIDSGNRDVTKNTVRGWSVQTS